MKNKKTVFTAAAMIVCISAAGTGVYAATASSWTVEDAFRHTYRSNGQFVYDYDEDGDFSGENDVVLDADDIKSLGKKSEVTVFGEFEPYADEYGDNTGTGILHLRIGENPQQ